LYQLELDEDIPWIDMMQSSHYHQENEILLPRNLIATYVGDTFGNVSHTFGNIGSTKVPLKRLIISKSTPEQFDTITRIKCQKFKLADIKPIPIDDLDIKPTKVQEIKAEEVKAQDVEMQNIRMTPADIKKTKRCPKGMRRNKQGECVATVAPKMETVAPKMEATKKTQNVPKKMDATKKTLEKTKRCPKGTRRNKTGECVAKQ
jgi:hypothetical protein